jgi:myo-inositol-1-phosphate synthase
VGATILHRTLAKLFIDRGLKLTSSYQLNYAGNTDFVNLAKRGESKSMTKEAVVESLIPYQFPMSSGFSFLHTQNDTKTAIIWLEGEKFGGAPIRLLAKLDVEDSPNSAGVIIDAIRCCKIARDWKN